MTPAQVAHIMSLVRKIIDHTACKEAAEALAAYTELEAALRDAPQQAEIDAITELNHAQWLALENVRHLAARNRNEEWAQHMLRWCTEAGNAARILRTPSAPTAPPEAKTEAERNAFSFGWFKAFEHMRNQQTDPLEKLTRENERMGLYDDMGAPTAVDPDELAERFEKMHAQGNKWISTIAAAKLARASKGTK